MWRWREGEVLFLIVRVVAGGWLLPEDEQGLASGITDSSSPRGTHSHYSGVGR